ncbi:MAG TPA: tetratricopeptide repeat protein [Pyrinomonadaceae bacterium]|nr:tetratricopeptide repeat protein [Pyrinomonadaceae bacterium]
MKPLFSLKLKSTLLVSLALLILSPATVLAQRGRIPVTTSSRQARRLFLQGLERSENIENAEAIPLLDRAIQADPNFALAYLVRAQVSPTFPEFRRFMDQAVSHSSSSRVSAGERYWILSAEAQADNDNKKSKANLDQLLRLFPNDARVHVLMSNYYRNTANDPAAARELERATHLDRNYAAAFNLLGYVYSALGNYNGSEQAFKTYIRLRPASPNPYDSYAELLLRIGRFDESIAQYRKALAHNPHFVSSLRGIGVNYIFKGDYAKAREAFQQEFDSAPDVGWKFNALNATASSYVHEGNTEEALRTLERLRALAGQEHDVPTALGTYEAAGLVLLEAGRLDDAVAQLDQMDRLREDPGLPDATRENFRVQAMFDRARVLIARHDFAAAQARIDELKPIVAARGNPFEERAVNELLGMSELEQGHYDQALAYFAKADQTDPYLLYYTAVAYERKGDSTNAMKLYKRIVDWNQDNIGYAVVRPRALAKVRS